MNISKRKMKGKRLYDDIDLIAEKDYTNVRALEGALKICNRNKRNVNPGEAAEPLRRRTLLQPYIA